ncbi:MAG TPA: hypothetical protein VN915_12705 [Elusimicrobiota bacterium]|nr:hypothetical protein [Elusimicrobiota bacterium]
MNALLAAACAGHLWCSYVRPLPAAKAAEACPTSAPAAVGGTQGYSDSLGSGLCFTSIEPMEIQGMVYRSYVFFGDGLLMVFSSYGEGSSSKMTSAREFFFFPRRGAPALTMDSKAGSVSVRMGDGARADIAPATAQLSGLERGSVTVSAKVDPAERGGVEIPRYAGLVLDAGFRMGESPSGLPNGTSTFRDANGRTCAVKNADLFAYANGDHSFKLTDAQLSAWLSTACPGLDAGF